MADNRYLNNPLTSGLPGRRFRKDLEEEVEYAKRVGGSPTAAAIRGGLASVIAAPVMAGEAVQQATEPARNAISNIAGGVSDFGKQLFTGEYLPPSAIAARPAPTPAPPPAPVQGRPLPPGVQVGVSDTGTTEYSDPPPAQPAAPSIGSAPGPRVDQFRDKGYYLPEQGRSGSLPRGVQMQVTDGKTEYSDLPKPSTIGKYQPGSLGDFAGILASSAIARNANVIGEKQQKGAFEKLKLTEAQKMFDLRNEYLGLNDISDPDGARRDEIERYLNVFSGKLKTDFTKEQMGAAKSILNNFDSSPEDKASATAFLSSQLAGNRSGNKATGQGQPTTQTFNTPVEVQTAKAAGKIKSGDIINTPNGQIRVK